MVELSKMKCSREDKWFLECALSRERAPAFCATVYPDTYAVNCVLKWTEAQALFV